jgi:hypothetical protein
MKLVSSLRASRGPADAKLFAEACGLTVAEASMRLASEPPALLVRLEDQAADEAVKKLRGGGMSVLACPLPVPSDRDRTLARTFAFTDAGATFTPRSDSPLEMPWGEVAIILKGSRAVRSRTERSEKETQLSIGTAVATGGLKFTTTTRKTVRTETEETEQFLFVYDRGGNCAAIYESVAAFTCLGKAMQPSRTANMATVARMLRERAPAAFYDERLVRMGRRSLPFLLSGERHSGGQDVSHTITETAGSVDVLAEVLRQAVVNRLLP